MAETPTKPLTPKEYLFVDAFFETKFNGTEAAIKVGYKPSSARQHAYRLLTKDHIEAEIERRKQQLAKRSEITYERWMKELKCLAFFDPGKMFDSIGNPIDVRELPAMERRAVAGYEVFEEFEGKGESRVQTGWTKRITLASKLPALMAFGKVVGYYVERKPILPQGGPPVQTRFDLSKLTSEELQQYLAMRSKALVVLNGHG